MLIILGRGLLVRLKGTQIVIDMYSCKEEVVSDSKVVETILQNAVEKYKMDAHAIYYNVEDNGEYSFSVPCKRGHINLHVYPELGFAAVDIFTCCDEADPDRLAVFLRKQFSPDKSKITFLQRGDFGSQNDMKPKHKSKMRAMHRAKSAGNRFLRIVMRPKSTE